eukprot:6316640-Pyramimonas_sp.AAC.1
MHALARHATDLPQWPPLYRRSCLLAVHRPPGTAPRRPDGMGHDLCVCGAVDADGGSPVVPGMGHLC